MILKSANLFKLLKLNRKKSKAEIFRNFRNVNKKPKEISATFAEGSDAFVSFLSFYFSLLLIWKLPGKIIFLYVITINGRL